MTGTKLPRELDTPAHRANLAAQVAGLAEDAAIAAETHAGYSSAAADAGDADMAREHAAEGWQCSNEAEAAAKYIQAIGAQADGDGHSRAVKAANRAYAAAKAARHNYESAACNAEPQIVAGRDYDGTAAMAERIRNAGGRRTDPEGEAYEYTERLCWLRLLFLLRRHPADIEAAIATGIVPERVAAEASKIMLPPNARPYAYGGGPDWDDEIPF